MGVMRCGVSGSAPQMIDSTGNGNSGTTAGSMTSGDLVSAQIGNGIDFDASDDEISFGDVDNAIATNGAHTYSCWFKADQTSVARRIIDMELNNQAGAHIYVNLNTLVFRQWDGSNYQDSSYAFTDTTGYHLATFSWDGSKVYHYIDGVIKNSGGSVCTGYVSSANFTLGGRTGITGQNFDGVIDQTKVKASTDTADWITTEYNNQSDEATFWGTWTDVGGGGGAIYTPKVRIY